MRASLALADLDYQVGNSLLTGQREEAGLGLYYYGARWYDPRMGRFIQPDTIVPNPRDVQSFDRYAYVNNNPLKYTDPTGHRLYYASGAGHDSSGTGYIQMMLSVFGDSGILNPVDIAAHDSQGSDILFTLGDDSRYPAGENALYITPATRPDTFAHYTVLPRPTNWRISEAVSKIQTDLGQSPLENGEQLNLFGYSTGSVIIAQSALQLANQGYVIDNLILVGSPILNDSELYQMLEGNDNIKNIIRVDIPGDEVATVNQGLLNQIEAGWVFYSKGDDHPHFKYAFGTSARQNTQELAAYMKKEGVR